MHTKLPGHFRHHSFTFTLTIATTTNHHKTTFLQIQNKMELDPCTCCEWLTQSPTSAQRRFSTGLGALHCRCCHWGRDELAEEDPRCTAELHVALDFPMADGWIYNRKVKGYRNNRSAEPSCTHGRKVKDSVSGHVQAIRSAQLALRNSNTIRPPILLDAFNLISPCFAHAKACTPIRAIVNAECARPAKRIKIQ